MAGRRAVIVAGVMSGMLMAAPMAASAEPAPPASAEAVAAQVDGVVAVAHTKADADATTGSATANALEVGGTPPVAQAGGTQQGTGNQAGAVLDTGDLPVGRVQVAPWDVGVSTGADARRATARAALLRLTLLGPGAPALLAVNVLQSYSEANHTDGLSTANSSSDGATVNVADLVNLVLLHSEASSQNGSKSYVIGLNGTELITNKDVGAACNIALPGILELVCVSASGGPGDKVVSASTVDAVVTAVSSGLTGKVTGVTSSAGPATTPAPSVLSGELSAGAAPAGLPRTGLAVGIATAVGVALAGAGAMLLWFRRRMAPAVYTV